MAKRSPRVSSAVAASRILGERLAWGALAAGAVLCLVAALLS